MRRSRSITADSRSRYPIERPHSKTMRLLSLTIVLALAACTGRAELVRGNALVALEHATIIDGTGAQPRGDGVVVLSGDRILKVGRMGQYRYPDATVVDLTG